MKPFLAVERGTKKRRRQFRGMAEREAIGMSGWRRLSFIAL